MQIERVALKVLDKKQILLYIALMNAIKSYREQREITQAQLAESLGYRFQSDIYRIEKRLDAGIGLKPKQAKELSEKLGIPRDLLLYPTEQAAA